MLSSFGTGPKYDHPPVTEVVCGVVFAPLKGLLAPHLGLLWEKYKPEYAECQEAPPLAIQVEGPPSAQTEVGFLEIPPLPRVWFIEPSGNRLVQVQRDRFHHNWRKINATDEYPRHERVLAVFNERFATFKSFLSENGLGELQLKQYEMTYVNHVIAGGGWDSVANIGKIFPDFAWQDRPDRPSGAPEGIHWKTVFALPEGTGRLHVTMRNGTRITDNQPILFFELTARGFSQESTTEGMRSWFGMAHSHIVQTFDDLVDKDFQRAVWGRRS